ncbi:MAG: hypothetical protein IAE82_02315 [Opitutaceae bacterium]|nr:hypothetical protein [Opitutaceae bacterium]
MCPNPASRRAARAGVCRRAFAAFAVLVFTLTAASSKAQPLVWDTTFDPVIVHRAGGFLAVHLALASDGGFLVHGDVTFLAGQRVPGIVRLGANGTPDGGFAFAGEALRRRDLVVPLDGGRFLVVHRANPEDGAGEPVIRRYEASGALDSSYADVAISSGVVTVVMGAEGMSDGATVIYGRFSSVGGQAHAGLARLTRTGELDGSFAPDMVVPNAEVSDVARAPGGALIARVPVGGLRQTLVRIDAGGQPEPGFVSPQFPYGPMLLVQRDGRVIFGGSRPIRLGADGTADTGFQPLPSSGETMTSYSLEGAVELASGELVLDVLAFGDWSITRTLQRATSEGVLIGPWSGSGSLKGATPDGRIITEVAGELEAADDFRLGVATLRRAPRFHVYPVSGTSITVVEPDLGFPGWVASADLDGAGTVWLAGAFSLVDGEARPGLARLLADGTVDTAFTPPLDLGRLWPAAYEADGHVWVYARETSDAWWRRLRRLDPNGALSATGTVESELGRSRARVLGLDRDGRILAGVVETADSSVLRLARFDRETGARVATLPPLFTGDFGTDNLYSPSQLTDARELADGSIVFAGAFRQVDGQDVPRLVKLRADGSVDTEYLARLAMHGVYYVKALQRDGAALLMVYGSEPLPQGFIRVLADGTVDPGFALEIEGDLASALPRGLTELPDGTFVSLFGPLQRWRHDGSRMLTTHAASGMTVYDVAQAADGDWVIGGEFGAKRLQALNTPGIVIPPVARSVATGERAEFSVEIGDADPATFQWQRGGVDIAGATRPTLVIAMTSSADAGAYRVVIRVGSATYVSEGVTLSVRPSTAHLVNFSARSRVPAGGPPQIAGFVTAGSTPRRVFLRGVGLNLQSGTYLGTRLMDPAIALFAGEDPVTSDAGSARTPEMLALGSQVGAFEPRDWEIVPGLFVNYDSALMRDLAGGAFTLQTSSPTGSTGISLAEFYDAGTGSAFGFVRNVSLRGRTGAGADTMIGGFVVRGEGGLRLLVRVVGVELERFGVGQVLENPRLRLYQGSTAIALNDDWDDRPASELSDLLASSRSVGAFSLAAGSQSAALLTQVLPGTYTVHAESVAGLEGEVLLELYVIDDPD